MKIIILGAGQVGTSLANSLSSEANDITVVDVDSDKLSVLQDRMDLKTIHGPCSHPEVLRSAGAEDADMVIAVTNSDEVNMIACQVTSTLFRTPTKIARVRSRDYFQYPELFKSPALPIDVTISPEQLVTDYIHRLIEFPGALQVLDFAENELQLVAVRAFSDSPMVGHPLRDLHDHLPNSSARLAAIYRHEQAILPKGHTIINAGDEVFFVAKRSDIHKVMQELHQKEKPVKRIMIAGGGNIGRRLAQTLERNYQIKLIDRSYSRTRILSEELRNTIVLHGNAADEELLLEENIDQTDIFCALTNDDEANILSAMLAKRLKARRVMALINRTAYVDLVESSLIDIAISPQQATIGSLLAHIRRGDVVNVHSLRRGAAEAIEAIVHGDNSSSKVVDRRVDAIGLPAGAVISSIVRESEVIVPHHDTVIRSGDHLIIFVVEKSLIPRVEELFQVDAIFI
ncbi:Trk system potassium transporter TrkA [Ectothiorhodospiraceae bacterium BW-2]|nr:Trk system potassium transporter TrkA [Ectothiorhodospiraceae bacterium BW-2]